MRFPSALLGDSSGAEADRTKSANVLMVRARPLVVKWKRRACGSAAQCQRRAVSAPRRALLGRVVVVAEPLPKPLADVPVRLACLLRRRN